MGEKIVAVIGGGITGAAIAYDLSLRGAKVVVFERGSIGSGTSGRTHGLLHSGCRYIRDTAIARECYLENMVLRRIAPWLFEKNGGLFIGVTDRDLEYLGFFLEGCRRAGIPIKELSRRDALKLEPNLNPRLKAAIVVPDGTFDPLKVILSFLASAKRYGADIRPFNEVIDFVVRDGEVAGLKIRDWVSLREYEFNVDLVINAAGPWAGIIAEKAGVKIPVKPSPGVMVALDGRVANMVINRLNPPSDGDIIVNHRGTSVIGTTSWYVDNPDLISAPKEHVELMIKRGAEMVPVVRETKIKAVYVSARPLVARENLGSGREVSRSFYIFDHEREGLYNFISVAGGKFTTARYMAEKVCDLATSKLGLDAPCRTREKPLVPYYYFFS